MQIRSILAKSVLTKSKLPESDYVINPYVGCAHGCVYCYAKFMKRFTGHKSEWGKFVDIKVNAPDLLQKQLRNWKPEKGSILLGSVTDAYQPLESKTQLTRNLLQLLRDSKCSISILTKSDLVLRDIDILRQLHDCSVGLSISFSEDNIRRHFEPGATPIERRVKALNQLHAAGIRTYVFIGPFFPILTDINKIIDLVHQDVHEVWGEALNLRCCGLNVEATLNKHFPKVAHEVLTLAKDRTYWSTAEEKLRRICNQYQKSVVRFYYH